MRIWIKLVGIDPSQTIPFAPTTFTINDSGVWTGSFSVVSLAPGAGYTLFIKGPNHLAKKVCNINPEEEQGGSYSCKVGQTIFLSPGTNILDFSNITLMAGDLPEVSGSQNGIVDAYDTTYVRTNLGSSDPSKLTVGDLNMDGIIDTQDYSMILQSLPIKFDEE